MATREALLRIFVKDAAGALKTPGANDKVKVNGAELVREAGGGFVHKLTKSTIELSIEYSGYVALRQWFDANAPAENPTLTPFWPGSSKDPDAPKSKRNGYLLACMNAMSATGGASSAASPKTFEFTITLHPAQEYVAVIGTDYWEGAVSGSPHAHKSGLDFPQYATTFAKHLYADKKLNDSAAFTMIDCQRGKAIIWLRSKANGWQPAYVTTRKLPAPDWPTAKSFVTWYNGILHGGISSAQYLGGPDIYKYLSDVGAQRPGTVVNFSVFSHSFVYGPILFNTPGSDSGTRMAVDLDMRYYDFEFLNRKSWPKLKAAFSNTGPAASEINIWGCFATDLYHEMVYFLNNSRASDKFIDKWSDPASPTTLSRKDVVAELNSAMDSGCYMKFIANHTGCRTYGGPPGYGAEWREYGKLAAISPAIKNLTKGHILAVPATLGKTASVRKLYESAELGSRKFDAFGYMAYSP